MVTGSKIRVGIVGVSPNRGFASIAHWLSIEELVTIVRKAEGSSSGPAAAQ
jgi:hypothetical protein